MLHKPYKSQNAHKKSKRLKFQSLEPRMVFDGALDSVIEVGLDSHHLLDAMLNDTPEREESSGIRESTVTWKENPDHSVRGHNDSVFLLPFIKFGNYSSHIKEVEFSYLSQGDQLNRFFKKEYQGVKGYIDLLNEIEWNYKNPDDGGDFIVTLSGPSNASPEAWQAVLRSIMFTHVGDNPQLNREINVGITYQDGTYEDHVVPIVIVPTDDALTWEAQTNRLRIRNNAVTPQDIFHSLSIKDPDNLTLESVIINIENPHSGDELIIFEDDQKNLELRQSQDNQKITLIGKASLAVYTDVLKALKFKRSSHNLKPCNIKIEFCQKANRVAEKRMVSVSFYEAIETMRSLVWQENSNPLIRGNNSPVHIFRDVFLKPLVNEIGSIEIKGLLPQDSLSRDYKTNWDVWTRQWHLNPFAKIYGERYIEIVDPITGDYIFKSNKAVPQKFWMSLLRSLTFNHTGDVLQEKNREIRVLIKDFSDKVMKEYVVPVEIKPIDDVMQWKAETNELTVRPGFFSGAIFKSLVLEDPDDVTLSSMIVRLKNGQSGDSLFLQGMKELEQKGIRVMRQNNQELKLEGVKNLSVYAEVLRELQFRSTSQDLTLREIEFESFNEEDGISLKRAFSILITNRIFISPNVQITSDDQISFMRITLVNALPGDILFLKQGWEKEANGIIIGKKRRDQEFRFRGLRTAQDYDRVLKNIYYKNMNFTPGMPEKGTKRQIRISTMDEYGNKKKQIFFLD